MNKGRGCKQVNDCLIAHTLSFIHYNKFYVLLTQAPVKREVKAEEDLQPSGRDRDHEKSRDSYRCV